MKAINFLEFVQKFEVEQKRIINHDLSRAKFHMLVKFYSQPFRPELITELFEGWKKDETSYFKNAGQYCNGTYTIRTIGMQEITKLHTSFTDGWMRYCDRWLTLDHFISDCSRAGIELTFKKEIVEEYFK